MYGCVVCVVVFVWCVVSTEYDLCDMDVRFDIDDVCYVT